MPDQLTDLYTGLTAAEAAARAAAGLANHPPASPTKTVGRIVAENTCTFFNLVFMVLAAALLAVGSYVHLGFLLVVVCNTAIGIFQQLRARRAIEKLTLIAARPVRCLRGGVWVETAAGALVQGDIVEFSAGDQICADAIVRAGLAYANEALITGEADPLPKPPGAALCSGSFVAAGRCTAQLTAVGAQSYASQLTVEAKRSARTAKSEMMASLDKLIRAIGLVLTPFGVALFFKQYRLLGLPLRDATEATVAALIGMIPEGLYLLTSVALAVSVARLARRRVLARDLNCIETLAHVDVLCVDKTGTITEPGMDAGAPVLLDPEAWPAARVERLLRAVFGSQAPENETAAALAARFAADTTCAERRWLVQNRVPFSSAYKWSAVSFKRHGSYVVGAPEIVAGPRWAQLAPQAEDLLRQGRRVLLLAACDALPDPAAGAIDADTLHFIALLPLAARIRSGAREVFSWLAAQGVAVKVLSGDAPQAAARVACQAGIPGTEDPGAVVDAAALPDEAALAAAAGGAVFGRVTPEQKRQLVRAWQARGHTVAMTGDGVNDVLALTQADCGIAMASGAQAASQAAQLVLLDSDFAALPAIVGEGRRVINNIQRSAALFMVKNIFSFLLAAVTLLFPLAYPLEPLQLSLIGALTIGLPSLVLALGPNPAPVRRPFLRRVFQAALPGGLTDFVLLTAILACGGALGLPRGECSTLCTAVLLVVGLCILWRLCVPFTPRTAVLWGTVAVLGAAGLPGLRPLLDLDPLGARGPWLLLLFAALAPLVLAAFCRLTERAFQNR